MENFTDSVTEKKTIELDSIGLKHLAETRKWTMFLSIIGFILCGLMLVMGLVILLLGSTGLGMASPMYMNANMMGFTAFQFIPLLLGCIIYFFPIYFLFQFSRYSKLALQNMDTSLLNRSLEFLKRFYRFMGIFTIVVLCLYVVIIGIACLTINSLSSVL